MSRKSSAPLAVKIISLHYNGSLQVLGVLSHTGRLWENGLDYSPIKHPLHLHRSNIMETPTVQFSLHLV